MSIDIATTITADEDFPLSELPEPRPERLESIETAARRNQQRGLFAGVGLRAYGERVGNKFEPLDTIITDLLGDLMHLCDATGIDFFGQCDLARIHYIAEIGGEG